MAQVGEPVGVAAASGIEGGKTGPFFQPAVQQAIMDTKTWSDGMMSCGDQDGFLNFLMACCCPCVSIYLSLERIGQVKLFEIVWDSNKFILAWLCVFAFDALAAAHVPPVLHAGKVVQNENGSVSKASDYTMGNLVSDLALLALVFGTLKGIKDKVRVVEQDSITFLKSLNLARCCICVQCFFVAQVSRHVNRLQGFWPAPGVQYASVAPGQAPPMQEAKPGSAPLVQGEVVNNAA